MKSRLLKCAVPGLILALLGAPSIARDVVVQSGDTLARIARDELGDAERWNEIAELNGIRDPRALRVGTALRIPGEGGSTPGEPMMLAPHIPDMPSVRALAGAVRFRSTPNAPWIDLTKSMALMDGSWIMTANTGRADIAAGDATIEIGSFTIVEAPMMQDAMGMMHTMLHLGELDVTAMDLPVMVKTKMGSVKLMESEGKVMASEDGSTRVFCYDGWIEVMNGMGKMMKIGPGQSATVSSAGEMQLGTFASPIVLKTPVEGMAVTDDDIVFEWSSVAGAQEYRFTLLSEDRSQPGIEQNVTSNTIRVQAVPDGRYFWRVWPVGMKSAISGALVPSKKAMLVVDRSAPLLQVSAMVTGVGMEARWMLKGRTAPKAMLMAGDKAITVMPDGAFEYVLPAMEGIAVVGVAARMRPGGSATRKALALVGATGGMATMSARAMAWVPEGKAMIAGQTAPSEVALAEGRNILPWKWEVGGEIIGEGTVEVFTDRTPPEILSVRAEPEQVMSGQPVRLFVMARDRGAGLGPASTAKLKVMGPRKFEMEVMASEMNSMNEYVFEFMTPKDMPDGMINVTHLEIGDMEGNMTVISSEGMSTENVDPKARSRRFIKNLFILGLGVLVGSL